MTEPVILQYPPEMQEEFAKMVAEMAKANEKPEPKPINEMYLWLDFYRVIMGNAQTDDMAAIANITDRAMKEFRDRYPDA